MARLKNRMGKVTLWVMPVVVVARFMLGITKAALSAPPPPVVTSVNELAVNFWCPIIGIFFWVVISLSVIMALWAAFTYVTASDDTEKTGKARKILTYAVIGIVVALVAGGFPALVGSVFNVTGLYVCYIF